MVWKSNWPSPVITRLVLISALSMSTKSSTMSTPLRNLPFRKAYQITSKIVNYAESKKIKLNQLTLKELKKIEPKLNEDILKVFDLKNSIKSKKSYGGTSFENVKKMIKKYKKESK